TDDFLHLYRIESIPHGRVTDLRRLSCRCDSMPRCRIGDEDSELDEVALLRVTRDNNLHEEAGVPEVTSLPLVATEPPQVLLNPVGFPIVVDDNYGSIAIGSLPKPSEHVFPGSSEYIDVGLLDLGLVDDD